jgi:glycerol-3-phosphate dehydrogenase
LTEDRADRASVRAPGDERARDLARLGAEQFDLLIIGGGITGAGIARDAALRGISTALVEKADYASGTSSKSSKLIHGGLRYLEHAQFRLVFEGTNERALLMRVAPHLVRPLEFLVPSYTHDKPGLFVLDVGLWIYDALSKFSSPKLHRTVRASRLMRIEPGLRKEALEGGLLYYDCTTDDARLTLETVNDARSLGVPALNYTEVVRLLKEGDRVVGAEVRDALTPGAAPFAVRAKVVVNATGPWSDRLRKLADERPILSTSKGVHIIVDAARLPVRHAIVMKQRRRVVFAIPWGDRTVLGTTDTFYEGRPEDVATDSEDVTYLLELANRYFPDAKLEPDDVLATWAGLRPLLRPAEGASRSASDVSREHEILVTPGFVTIAGGKLTTYRRMAAEVVEAAGEQLGSFGPCGTLDRPLPGGAGLDGYAAVTRLAEPLTKEVDHAVAKHLCSTYGARAPSVVERIRKNAILGERLDPELPYVLAQVDAAVDEEQGRTLDDLLGRRIPLLLRSRDQGLGAAERVARRMGERLGWTAAETKGQVEAYRRIVEITRRWRKGPAAKPHPSP